MCIVIFLWRMHICKNRNFRYCIMFKQKSKCHIPEIIKLFESSKLFCFFLDRIKGIHDAIHYAFHA